MCLLCASLGSRRPRNRRAIPWRMLQERPAKRRRTRIRRSRRRFTRTTILRRACRSRRRPVRPRTMPVEKQPARRDRRQEPPGKLETSLKKIRIVNRRGENGFRRNATRLLRLKGNLIFWDANWKRLKWNTTLTPKRPCSSRTRAPKLTRSMERLTQKSRSWIS